MTESNNWKDHCPGCFKQKGQTSICPHCNYNDSEQRSPLALPHWYLLQSQFRVGKVLGKPGGFGVTYLAWDEKLATLVAIKEYLPRDLAGRETGQSQIVAHSREDKELFKEGLGQFIQEARTLARMNHTNIVRVRHFFEENQTGYLVMDYYEGITLEEYLKQKGKGKGKGGKLSEKLAVDILMPVLDGLRDVHKLGFLHRDVKPQNIYMTHSGQIILLDFGAARQAVAARSRSLSVVLTPGYAPYEQYLRRGKQGPWTDLYSAAAILYQMVVGEVPPEAPERVLNDPIEFPDSLSTWLRDNLVSALAVEPVERPQTIAEWQDLLLAKKSPHSHSHSQPVQKPVDPVPKPKLNLWLWGFTSLVVVFAMLVVLWWRNDAQQRPIRDDQAQVENSILALQAEVSRLLQVCERHFQANRLTTGVGGTALACYQDVLKKDPINVDALAGLEKIEARYVIWINEALEVGKISEAKGYLESLRLVNPESPKLAQFEERIASILAGGDVFRDSLKDGSLGPEMVWIPAGSFRMGDLQGGGGSDEKPIHRVSVSRFAMGKYEVTFAEYDRFAEATGRNKPSDRGWGRGNRPVINVSWHDATAYAGWLSQQTGKQYSLPTEAEWEYAARARTETKYWWGNEIGSNKANCSNSYCGDSFEYTAPVGSFAPNAFKLYDTVGNVWEWTCSEYENRYNGKETVCINHSIMKNSGVNTSIFVCAADN